MGGKDSPKLQSSYILSDEDFEYIREKYPETVKWVTQVNCAWCGTKIGFKAAFPNQSLGISHGICPSCYGIQMDNLKQD